MASNRRPNALSLVALVVAYNGCVTVVRGGFVYRPSACVVLSVSMFACGSGRIEERRAPHVLPSHASPALSTNSIKDAAIEGFVVDSTTRQPVAGTTIIATPLDGSQTLTDISDDAGHYRLELAAGVYHVQVYYADTLLDRGNISVKSNELVHLDTDIEHEIIVATERAEAPPCPPVVGQTAVSSWEIDQLAADVLARGIAVIPDGGLLPDQGPIYVASDVDGPVHLTAAALPQKRATRFALRTMRELQAEADRRRTHFEYVRFTQLDISGTCATVDIGIHIMTPSRSHDTFLCCCSATDVYDKRNGSWVFRTNVVTSCS